MTVAHAAVRVPATTANLGAGFDAFGAAVSLHLRARSLPRGARRVITVGEGAGEVGEGDDNLVWQAFDAFCGRVGVATPDVSVEVRSDIPLERGLGSSSAALVAGVALARGVTGRAVGDLALARLAAELEGHPDNVVPALLGGLTCTARDASGELVVRRVQPHPRLRPVLLVPATRQGTAAARGELPGDLATAEVAVQIGRAGHVLAALAGLWPAAPELGGDLLHEPARLASQPASAAVLGALRDSGMHAWLSGAGPAVAGAVAAADGGAVGRIRELASLHGFAVRALAWDLAGAVAAAPGGHAGNEPVS